MVTRARHSFGLSWILFAVSLAAHVADEATHNFLATYNPVVRMIRARLPLLPLPTFTFTIWISGLVVGILLLFALSPIAFRGHRLIVTAAFPLVLVVGILNAALHIGSSLYMGRWMPGAYSAPLLLAAAIWLLSAALRLRNLQA